MNKWKYFYPWGSVDVYQQHLVGQLLVRERPVFPGPIERDVN